MRPIRHSVNAVGKCMGYDGTYHSSDWFPLAAAAKAVGMYVRAVVLVDGVRLIMHGHVVPPKGKVQSLILGPHTLFVAKKKQTQTSSWLLSTKLFKDTWTTNQHKEITGRRMTFIIV